MPGFRKGGEYAFRVVPSGYEFLGPGNDVLYQVPRNYNDAIAKAHDIAYGQLQRKGINPYITFNAADEEFLNNLQPNDVATIAARWIFQGKKTLASFGILPSGTSCPRRKVRSGLTLQSKTRIITGFIVQIQPKLQWMPAATRSWRQKTLTSVRARILRQLSTRFPRQQGWTVLLVTTTYWLSCPAEEVRQPATAKKRLYPRIRVYSVLCSRKR